MKSFKDRSAEILAIDEDLFIFPLADNSKVPALKGIGFEKARRGNFPKEWNGSFNIGITCKQTVVIDIDSEEALKRMKGQPGWSEETFCVRTPKGWHFYWRLPKETWLPKQFNGDSFYGSGVDTRNPEKGYVVGWGSMINGKEYTVANDQPINNIPVGMLQKLLEVPELQVQQKKAPKILKGNRNAAFTSLAGTLVKNYFRDDEVLRILKHFNDTETDQPMPSTELENIARYAISRWRVGDKSEYNGVAVEKGRTEQQTLETALKRLKIKVRYNIRHYAVEVLRGDKWIRLEDGDEASLRYEVQEKCLYFPEIKESKTSGRRLVTKAVKMGSAVFRTALLATSWKRQEDPFITWLEQLPPWDGEERINNLLGHFFNSDSPDELLSWAVWGTVGGAIRRAYHPGTKQDEMPILVGGQGIGKSTFWSLLLPNEDWFSDNLNLSDNAQQRVEALTGVVIVENAELSGLTRTELSSLKAFLSRGIDKLRRAYAHYPSGIPRRCVLVGTTNQLHCLPNDDSGNRRFVPCRVSGDLSVPARIRQELPEIRDQLWAEGLHRYRHGESSFFPFDKLEHILWEETETHESQDEVINSQVEKVLNQLKTLEPTKELYKLSEITDRMGLQAPRKGIQRDVGAALRALGCERKKVRKLGWVWQVPRNRPWDDGSQPTDVF